MAFKPTQGLEVVPVQVNRTWLGFIVTLQVPADQPEIETVLISDRRHPSRLLEASKSSKTRISKVGAQCIGSVEAIEMVQHRGRVDDAEIWNEFRPQGKKLQ